jgi:hypothetical protein
MHNRTLVSTFLVVLFCSTPAGAAEEEITFARESPCVRASRIQSEVPCFENGSRETQALRQDVELTTNAEYFTVSTRQCQAVVALGYKQKNQLVSVEGEVKNDTCGASNGSFVVSVSTTHDNGEQNTQEYTQPWTREDNQPVAFSAEYPIPENVLLVVRAQRVRCTCADAAP